MAKVSVIIPVYNAEKYLGDTLDSVLGQSFSDIEVVCVNDGSTDRSARILEEYEKSDSRVVVVNQDNSGGSSARNKGIEKSSGEYIMFLDSDDMYAENIIAEAYDRAIETESDIVFYNFARFIGRPTKMATKNKTSPTSDLMSFTKETYAERFFNDFAIITWNKLIKKSVIDKNNLLFDTQLSHNHDVDFSIRLMLVANTYSWLDKIGYYYRANDSGLTATRRSDPTNVLKILVDLNKQIELSHKVVKNSFDNYVADMIAGTIIKYSGDKDKVRQLVEFSYSVVIPELGLDSDDVSEPTGLFEIVKQGDYRGVERFLSNPKRKAKNIIKYSYNIVQGILSRITV